MKLSLCMIVKNEEAFLEQCLSSVRDLVDEIIIVDTGSTDATLHIAKRFGAIIIPFLWNNDFSRARNESLHHATGDWILVLDADEVLHDPEGVRQAIHTGNQQHMNQQHIDGYRIRIRNYVHLQASEIKAGVIPIAPSPITHGANAYFTSTTIRLFRKRNDIYYVGKVHELLNIDKDQSRVRISDITIHHYGYLRDASMLKQKKELYFQIGLQKVEEEKTPEAYAELGALHFDRKEFQEAKRCFQIAIQTKPAVLEWYHTLAIIYKQLREYEQAEAILQKAILFKKEDVETYLLENPHPFIFASLGELFYRKRSYKKAGFFLQKAIEQHHPYKELLISAMHKCQQKMQP